MNQTDRTILSFLAGAAVGVVAGILIAPDKGSVTRERILRGAEELAGEVEDSIRAATSEPAPAPGRERKQQMDMQADELPAV